VAIGLIQYFLKKEVPIEMGGIDRISSHMVSSQRSNIADILKVMGRLQNEVEDYGRHGVPKVEIVARAHVEGIPEDMVIAALDHLQLMSDIIPYGNDRYKVTSSL